MKMISSRQVPSLRLSARSACFSEWYCLDVWMCAIFLLEDTNGCGMSDMRKDVQDIFKLTPHDKQVMMFSATLSKEIRPVCKRFMQDVMSLDHILISWFVLPLKYCLMGVT